MAGVCAIPEKAKLHLAMVALQFGYAGFHIVSRAALNMGEGTANPYFLILDTILPSCVIITANQGFYLLGLYHTTPTFASAIQNSVPAITFLMAAALRLEEIHMKRRDGLAKIVGTIACVGGASIITLYKAFVETDVEHWKIHSEGELFTILYAGFVASGIAFSIQIWCIDRGGPVFVAVYQPVQTIAVAVMASIILGEQIIGAILIIVGLYLVLWGKNEEKRVELLAKTSIIPSESQHQNHGLNVDETKGLILNINTSDHYSTKNLTQPLLIPTAASSSPDQ
eukprot:Gb_29218 [translate_table: standard]